MANPLLRVLYGLQNEYKDPHYVSNMHHISSSLHIYMYDTHDHSIDQFKFFPTLAHPQWLCVT